MKPFYITTTLPYVNAAPHIGFAMEIIQADVIARFHRLQGNTVIFNFGTDEHGQKIYEKAIEQGISPQAYCDVYAEKFDALKDALHLTYTHFIRTTDASHMKAAQIFWMRCFEKGDIYKKNYQTKYCVGCELEKTDSELDHGICPIHPNKELEIREEENYFFRFSAYQEKLLELYTNYADFVLPAHRLTEIRKFVESGLADFSISRLKEKMPWGIEVPNDSAHVMYVWFDALINYISTLGWPDGEEYLTFWPGVQMAGKDNLRQQASIWQAMLLSSGVPASKQIYIHGFITAEGKKMSKSLGNVVDPYEIVKEYGTDALRYYLLREIPYGEDGDYSTERMEKRYEELANQLGNLVSRVAAMSESYFNGELEVISKERKELDQRLKESMNRYDFKTYLDAVFELVGEANEYIEKKAPFRLVKEDKEAAKGVLSELAEMIRFIAQALLPMMPQTAEEILRRYNGVIQKGEPLFPRRDLIPDTLSHTS